MSELKTLSDAATKGRVYLIQKGGAYYRPNSRGYTTSALTAGRYTLADAISISHPNGSDGPRDSMSYIHENEVVCENLEFHRATIKQARTDALQEAHDAVAKVAAPVEGTPYITGPRKFCAALTALMEADT